MMMDEDTDVSILFSAELQFNECLSKAYRGLFSFEHSFSDQKKKKIADLKLEYDDFSKAINILEDRFSKRNQLLAAIAKGHINEPNILSVISKYSENASKHAEDNSLPVNKLLLSKYKIVRKRFNKIPMASKRILLVQEVVVKGEQKKLLVNDDQYLYIADVTDQNIAEFYAHYSNYEIIPVLNSLGRVTGVIVISEGEIILAGDVTKVDFVSIGNYHNMNSTTVLFRGILERQVRERN